MHILSSREPIKIYDKNFFFSYTMKTVRLVCFCLIVNIEKKRSLKKPFWSSLLIFLEMIFSLLPPMPKNAKNIMIGDGICILI